MLLHLASPLFGSSCSLYRLCVSCYIEVRSIFNTLFQPDVIFLKINKASLLVRKRTNWRAWFDTSVDIWLLYTVRKSQALTCILGDLSIISTYSYDPLVRLSPKLVFYLKFTLCLPPIHNILKLMYRRNGWQHIVLSMFIECYPSHMRLFPPYFH